MTLIIYSITVYDIFIYSPDEVKTCIKEKIATNCESNMDDFKCKLFERCKSEDEADQTKQCVKDFCQEPDNKDAFECLALECKQPNQLPRDKLNCIKEACASNEDKMICQKISACAAKNPGGLLGKIIVFKCIQNSVFNENNVE